MTKNKITLGDIFFEMDLIGDHEPFRSLKVSRIRSIDQAREGDLVFVAQDAYLKDFQSTQASFAVVSDSLWQKAYERRPQKMVLLRSKDAMLAFAKVSKYFQVEPMRAEGVHASACIHPEARLGKNISIGANVVIEKNVEIGDDCILHANSFLGEGVVLGKGVVLFPGVVLYQNSILGDRVRIHANAVIGADGFGYVQEKSAQGVKHIKIHHMGIVRIGNDVEIGASTTIDRGTMGETVIGDGCIIDNQVQVGHNCQIAEGVILCGNVGISGSAVIGKYAVIGGMSGVGNKVVIGAGAMITGFSAISQSVPAKAVYGGVPARSWRETLKIQAVISRLPEFYETWKKK